MGDTEDIHQIKSIKNKPFPLLTNPFLSSQHHAKTWMNMDRKGIMSERPKKKDRTSEYGYVGNVMKDLIIKCMRKQCPRQLELYDR